MPFAISAPAFALGYEGIQTFHLAFSTQSFDSADAGRRPLDPSLKPHSCGFSHSRRTSTAGTTNPPTRQNIAPLPDTGPARLATGLPFPEWQCHGLLFLSPNRTPLFDESWACFHPGSRIREQGGSFPHGFSLAWLCDGLASCANPSLDGSVRCLTHRRLTPYALDGLRSTPACESCAGSAGLSALDAQPSAYAVRGQRSTQQKNAGIFKEVLFR